MVFFPPAKLNLGLFVTGKRPDGFHNLESVFVQIPWCDILELQRSANDPFHLSYSGLPIPSVDGRPNLIEQAYRALIDLGCNIPPLHATLHKIIPMGAGLGGGSSDGAWMLRALNQWADLGLEASTLHEVALSLGSDCPFFINDGAAFVHGRGENLEHLSAPTWSWRGWHVAVIYPGVHVSTQEAFGALSPSEAPWDLRKLHQTPVTEWAKAGLRNDFQPGVSAQHPEIAAALKLVANGAAYAQMTGTGSAVFGLYPSLEQAMRTADEATIKGWTSWSGTLDR